MEKKTGMILAAAASVLLLLAGTYFSESPQAQQTDDPPAVIMTACTECHTTRRICDNLGRKGTWEWARTIERMAARGADVEPEDIPDLAEYLSSLEPGSGPVCQ